MVSLECLIERWGLFSHCHGNLSMQRCTSSASELQFFLFFFLQLFFFHIGLGSCCPHRKDLPLDITALAQEVFDILRAPANPVPRTPESHRRKKSQFFINSSSKKAKSVTLHIQGLDSTVSGWGCSRYSSAHVLQVNQRCSFFSAGPAEPLRGGSSESQRGHQLHLPDGLQAMHRPHPFRPSNRGSAPLTDWPLHTARTWVVVVIHFWERVSLIFLIFAESGLRHSCNSSVVGTTGSEEWGGRGGKVLQFYTFEVKIVLDFPCHSVSFNWCLEQVLHVFISLFLINSFS